MLLSPLCVYTTHTLFITLGDGLIDPSFGPVNRSIDQARGAHPTDRTLRVPTQDGARPTPRAPSRSTPHAHYPTRLSHFTVHSVIFDKASAIFFVSLSHFATSLL
jgi:hypothetical protein